MTFREKLALEHPEMVNEERLGDGMGCPEYYGYEDIHDCFGTSCPECWSREIPEPEALNRSEAPNSSDTISRQAAIDALDKRFNSIPMAQTAEILMLRKDLRNLPPAQPEHTCLTCGRTANNGGWYKDGRTRCPIEEHYALPKDGHCHLWEKQKPWEDDYPERRADAGK